MTRPAFDQEFWEQLYREAPTRWSGQPNVALVAEASDLAPGTALDVGSGEGGDAIWLARRGWQVTGTDISTVALGRAAEAAAAAGVTVTWLHADLTAEPVAGSFDLVSAHYLHLPEAQRRVVHERLAAAVAPGGTLLLVAHEEPAGHEHGHGHGDPGWDMTGMFWTAAEEAARLDPAEWDVVTAEHRPRTAVRDGQQIERPDVVLRARRRG